MNADRKHAQGVPGRDAGLRERDDILRDRQRHSRHLPGGGARLGAARESAPDAALDLPGGLLPARQRIQGMCMRMCMRATWRGCSVVFCV